MNIQDKIIMMSKLSIYNKNLDRKKSKVTDFYLTDYVYLRNLKARIFALLGCAIIISIYIVNKISSEEFDIQKFNYFLELKKLGILVFFIVMFCTTINTVISFKKYKKIDEKNKKYFNLISKLESLKKMDENLEEESTYYKSKGDIKENESNALF